MSGPHYERFSRFSSFCFTFIGKLKPQLKRKNQKKKWTFFVLLITVYWCKFRYVTIQGRIPLTFRTKDDYRRPILLKLHLFLFSFSINTHFTLLEDLEKYLMFPRNEYPLPVGINFSEVKPYRNPAYRNSYVKQQGVFSGRTFFIFLRN